MRYRLKRRGLATGPITMDDRLYVEHIDTQDETMALADTLVQDQGRSRDYWLQMLTDGGRV